MTVSRETPVAPPAAHEAFGEFLPLAVRYVELLAGPGIDRGLLGPREVPRLWDRHLLNCVALINELAAQDDVGDVGSGAGLPGVVLGLRRPDVSVTLVEPLLRRTTFLEEVVAELGLGNVRVLRGRAEELAGSVLFDVVTARAVAPLERLAAWTLPLLRPGGRLLAMKGSAAADELRTAQPVLARLGGTAAEVVPVGSGDAATWIVRVTADGFQCGMSSGPAAGGFAPAARARPRAAATSPGGRRPGSGYDPAGTASCRAGHAATAERAANPEETAS